MRHKQGEIIIAGWTCARTLTVCQHFRSTSIAGFVPKFRLIVDVALCEAPISLMSRGDARVPARKRALAVRCAAARCYLITRGLETSHLLPARLSGTHEKQSPALQSHAQPTGRPTRGWAVMCAPSPQRICLLWLTGCLAVRQSQHSPCGVHQSCRALRGRMSHSPPPRAGAEAPFSLQVRHVAGGTEGRTARQPQSWGSGPHLSKHTRGVAGGSEGRTARQPQSWGSGPLLRPPSQDPFPAIRSAVLLGGTACASSPSASPPPAPCSAWPCAACSSCSSCSKCAACPNCGTAAACSCLLGKHAQQHSGAEHDSC